MGNISCSVPGSALMPSATHSESEDIGKPSIVRVLEALAPSAGLDLDETVHGWKAMRCPWHDDRAASASYNTTTEYFRCHGCGVHGDGYDLIQEARQCDFQTARAEAVKMCGGMLASGSEAAGSARRSKLTDRRNPQRAKLIRSRYGSKSR